MRYVLERVLMGIMAIFTVATLTFVLMKSVPGDPLQTEKAITPAIRANLEERYGLNKPVFEQYIIYMEKMFIHGDFGISFKQANRSVNTIIKNHFWISALLGIIALFGALVTGVTIGVIAAINRSKWQDYVAMIIAVLGTSIPSFCLAYLLQSFFAIQLKILPTAGFESFKYLVLPSMSLGMIVMAAMSRLMRSSMLDVVQQDYIRTARAKGLSRFQVTLKHQIRNAILPVIIYFGPLFSAVTTGTFVIERIFGIPGLGRFFVDSINELDYTVIMGLTVFYAGFSIVVILIVDLCYSLIDPRIRLSN
ncbi:MAG: ABC transporter permease [Proteobacteria bacterium]|nr:ABC transporter permease [Pseudomonadota bacterium]